MYLEDLVGLCEFGVNRFKIFVEGKAVAIVEKLDNNIGEIFGGLPIQKYNIQIIEGKTTMFIYV